MMGSEVYHGYRMEINLFKAVNPDKIKMSRFWVSFE